MLKPERVTFSADDDQFHQYPTTDQLDTFFHDSLVHYSTEFQKKIDQPNTSTVRHSNSLDELSSVPMSSQEQHPVEEHQPPPPPPSEQVPLLNDPNLHQLDALALQQLALGSNTPEDNLQTSPSNTTSLADIQKEIDRVKRMKSSRTYSSPTSSVYSRLTGNSFNGSNNNIDLSSMTHSVHFTDKETPNNRLPFSSTFITSIPESIVPASGASSSNENHFIPIDHIESPSLEDREVFETFHTKQTSAPGVAIRQPGNALNRHISTSEADLLASLHRSASKQGLDAQSDHGTTYSGASDEMIFNEWDKERNLFQDYINSLRTEIRVLLQERADYQKQMETINSNLSEHQRLNVNQIHFDQKKFDLLQKSLEEKNLVLEQIQKEYEILKEKNTNLTRKVSNLRCDAKSQTGVIDELKQKIADLTVDFQNHVIVKRRLESSIVNLEGDCKLLDTERLRLTNEMKDSLAVRQDLDRVLQQANVQIAEQGSTIEMLRSDNIQIRSQLSATQRRMLQEKQQVMDYLRQIETDLVEKEQIKQREAILRKDYEKLQLIHQQDRQEIEQLNGQINQDREKLNKLEQERIQLLKTMENFDDQQAKLQSQLDSYRTASKRLYTHFKIPFDSIQSIDQLIPMLEDRYRSEQVVQARVHEVSLQQSPPQEMEELQRLREELGFKDIQLKQLDEANQAWQQYQENQLNLLRDRLEITDSENSSFEDIVQQLEDRLSDLHEQLRTQQRINEQQKVVYQSRDTQTEDDKIQEILAEKDEIDGKQQDEIRQLRENLTTLTGQCARLDEANRAWQQYHQDEFDGFRDKLRKSLPVDSSQSLGDAADMIAAHLNQMKHEQDDLRSKTVDDDQTLRQTYGDQINALNAELQLIKQHNDHLQTEKYILNQQLEKQSLMNIHQERNTPTPDSITSDSKLVKKHTYSPQNNEVPIHHITPVQSASPLSDDHQQELQQLRQELARLTNQCAQLDQANQAWQTFQQTQFDNFKNTLQPHFPIDESSSLDQAAQQIAEQINKERSDFTRQYLVLEKVNEQLRSESTEYIETIDQLNDELSTIRDKTQQFNDSVDPRAADEAEIRDLREKFVSLTAQLDESKRAWEEYKEAQVAMVKDRLERCLSLDYERSLDEIAEQIVDQVTQEREEFNEKYQTLEQTNNDLRSESDENMQAMRESYNNTMNHLNQELLAMKETCDQLNTERQTLIGELQQRTTELNFEQARQSSQRATPNMLQNLFKEVPIHTSGSSTRQETDEGQQLRENIAALTAQCAQLDEANRAWQLYHQTQLNNFQNKLHDYIPVDGNTSLDEIADQIIHQVTTERDDAREKHQGLERAYNDRQSDADIEAVRQSYMNTVNELNQKLLTMKQDYDLLDNEKQVLVSELEQRAMDDTRNQIKRTTEKVTSDVRKQPFEEVPIHTNAPNVDQNLEEIRQLRENVTALTAQCAQLDQANHAWQLYQQKQLEDFRNKLQECLSVEDDASFPDMAQQIVYQLAQERQDFNKKYQALEQANHELQSDQHLQSVRQPYMNTIDELNQELSTIKEAYDQLDQQNRMLTDQLEQQALQILPQTSTRTFERISPDPAKLFLAQVPIHTSAPNAHQNAEEIQQLRENVAALTAQCSQLDEANHAWQAYQQAQLDNLRNKLADYVPIEENMSLDQIGQQVVAQLTQQEEDFNDRSQTMEKANDALRSESANALETAKQSYVNTIDQLNQELVEMKEAYNQLEEERQNLVDELEKQSMAAAQDSVRRTTERVATSNMWDEGFDQVPIHTSSVEVEAKKREIHDLQEKVVALTTQCTQLDEANRAWQAYQQAQLNSLRNNLADYIPIEENMSLDQIGKQVVAQLTQHEEDSNDRFQAMEKANDALRSESNNALETAKQSYASTIDQLNQELVEMKEAYNQLEEERQNLVDELEKQSMAAAQDSVRRTTERVATSNMWDEGFDQVPIHTSSVEVEAKKREIQDLQEKVAALTAQCTQLDEANRAWQAYQQAQLDNLRNNLVDYVPLEENMSLDQIGQRVVAQLTQEQQDFNDRSQAMEKANDALRSEYTTTVDTMRQSHADIIHQLNQELVEMREAYNQLDTERQNLLDQLQKQSIAAEQDQIRRMTEKVASTNMWNEAFDEVPIHTSGRDVEDKKKEIQELQEKVALLTTQCSQLDEANHAWQAYQQAQLDALRTKLIEYVPLEENSSLDAIGQQIVHELTQEREDFNGRSQAILRANDELETTKQSYMTSVDQLNRELVEMKEAYDQLFTQNQNLLDELQKQSIAAAQSQMKPTTERVASSNIWEQGFDQVPIHTNGSDLEEKKKEIQDLQEKVAGLIAQCSQLDEANRAWQAYQQAQLDSLRNKLADYIPIEENMSLDQIGEQVVAQLTQHEEDSNDRFQAMEKANGALRSESNNALETAKQSYVNTIDQLNQELVEMKEAYNQLEEERQNLVDELEKQSMAAAQDSVKRTTERVATSNMWDEGFDQVPIHTSSVEVEEKKREIHDLQEKVAALTAQCIQLEEANRAWQAYQQAQLDSLRNKLVDHIPVEENMSLDQIGEQVVAQLTQHEEDSNDRFQAMDKANDALRSESASAMDQLNQELVEMKEAYNQLDTEKQNLLNELLKRSAEAEQDPIRPTTEKVASSNLWDEGFDQVPIHTSGDEEKIASLTAQCAQLEEASRAWQSLHQNQVENFKNRLHDHLPVEGNDTLDDLAREIIDQMARERNDARERYEELEKVTDNLRTGSTTNLETMRQSYMDMVNELKDELLSLQKAYEKLDNENEVLKDRLEIGSTSTELPPVNLFEEVPLQTSNNNADQDNEELKQLREKLAQVNSQIAELGETARTSQESHQSQLDNFRNKLKEYVEFDDDFPLNEMADRIADQITQEREAFVERYEFLEKANEGLHEESVNEKKNFLLLKEQYDALIDEKETLIAQIENQQQDKQTADSTNVALLEQQNEMAQLRELRTEFDEAQHSWEQLEQEHLNLLRTLLPFSTANSLEDIIQEVTSHVNHLTGEIETLKQREEKPTDDRILEELASLQNQCAQSDIANQAWQSFYDQQVQSLKNTFRNNLPSDEELNFEQIIQSLAAQLDSNETDQMKKRLNELQETNNLLIDTNQNLTYRLNQMERPSSPFISQDHLKQVRRTPIQDVQIHRVTPVQSASSANITEEELQQLQNNLSGLTTQCLQLDEANRAWQQYHQTQLENFRKQLQDWISCDENDTLEQIGQRIILQLDQLASSKEQTDLPTNATIDALNKRIVGYQMNESTLTQNIEQLNQDLIDVQDDCEDLRQDNAQLVSSVEEMKQQNDSLQVKLHELEQRPNLSAFQRVDPSRDEIQQLRDELAAASAHCSQLEEANRAWQKYQSDTIESFRQNLQEKMPIVETDENPSLDSIAQQVINHLDQLNSQRDQLLQQNDSLKADIIARTKELDGLGAADDRTRLRDRVSQDRQFTEARIHEVSPVQSASPRSDDHQQELQQLRQELVLLTNQCAQLDQANQAWQTFQQTQFDNFKNTLQPHFPIDESSSLDQAAQQIAEQINKERSDFTRQYLVLEKVNEQLRSESTEYIETIDQLNDDLSTIRDKTQQFNNSVDSRAADEAEIRDLREKLVSLTAHLDESKRAWEEYKEAQVAMLKDRLERCLSLDYERSLDEIAEQIVDQVTQEREEFNEKYQTLEQTNNDLQSDAHLESIRQPYISTIDELNQELSTMKEAYDQLNQRAPQAAPEELTENFEQSSSDPSVAAVTEAPLHTSVPNVHQDAEEIQRLRDNVVALSAQCAQLDAANHAWQSYQKAQLDNLRNKLVDYIPIEENSSVDEIAQQVVNQLTARSQPTESADSELHSETSNDPETKQSYMNRIDQLNHELEEMREAYNQLDTERQSLLHELQKRSAEAEQNPIRLSERVATSNMWDEGFDQVPIHTSSADVEDKRKEIQDLQEKVAALTAQCAQLDEANRAWQVYQQTQLDNLRNKLVDYIPVEENMSLDQIGQQVVYQLSTRLQPTERTDDEGHSEALRDAEREKQSYMDTIDQLNQEKQNLLNELHKRSAEAEQDPIRPTTEKVASSNLWDEGFDQVPIHTSGDEEKIASLTAQCAQLEEASRAWQSLHQNQVENFKNRLHDHLPVDGNDTLDDIAREIIDQMARERNDARERYEELEKVTDNLRTELNNATPLTEQLSTETVDELTAELSNLRNQYEELEKINRELLSEREQLNGRLNELTAAAEEMELKASAIPVESEEVRQMRSDFATVTSQLAELNQSNENDLNAFRDRLQNWITLSSSSTLDDIAEQLNSHFEQQLPPEKVGLGTQTARTILRDSSTQVDPIEMIDQDIQTESLLHIWSMSNDDNLYTDSDDDDRLRDYIDEIRSLPPLELSHRLTDRCEQILSKQNFDHQSEPDLQPNHLALIALFSLYNQHLTDDAKQLYNDTVIRALRQEYELINNEKNDYLEKYLQLVDSSDQKLNHLQNQYDELLEQDELGRFNSQKTIEDLKSAYELQLYHLNQDNEQWKLNYKNLDEQYQQIKDQNYDELEKEYQQLREDYNELINKNELLQDYNSQMYQNKLQGLNPNAHDVDIQCNLTEENQAAASGWGNDWEEDTTKTELAVQEQGAETTSNEEEIHRLKAMIEEIQIENQYLKELNTQFSNIQPTADRPVCIENSAQTESENASTEDNDWNAQFSPLEITTEERTPSSIIKQTTDNQTQTDEQSQEKLTQVNSKLQRALQTIKAKVHQAVNNRPDLFADVGEDTLERLDHLISTIDEQTTQIDQLRDECQQAQSQIDELQNALETSRSYADNRNESVLSATVLSDDISQSEQEDCKQQIEQLRQELSQSEDERSLIRERLNEVELEYQQAIDDRTSTIATYEEHLQGLIRERDTLIEQQQQTPSVDSSSLPEKAFDASSDQQIQSLTEELEEKSEELKDLTEKYLALRSQLDANTNVQTLFDAYKQETEQRMADYQNQVEQLTHERRNLLDERQMSTASPLPTADTDNQAKVNTKLKRALHSLKEKINRVVTEQPDLFHNVGAETSERLDHLISTVEHQATQIGTLQAERNEIEAQLQNEIRELQGSVEAYRYQIENERPVRSEQLVTSEAPPSDEISQPTHDDHEQLIQELQQKLSRNEDERSLLRERLNEVEVEYRQAIDDGASTVAMYEEQLQSLVQERNALVEQQDLHAADSRHEMEQLKEQLAYLKQAPASSNEDVQSLQTVIREQAEEMRDMSEKYFALATQMDDQKEFDQYKKEMDERVQQYEGQIEHLIREHQSLTDQVQNKTTSVSTADGETQTEDQQHDKLSQTNTKLKRALQNLKEKIHRLVSERPDLFADIGDDTNERLDRLVSLVGHQASQIENLHAERQQSEGQLRNEIQELQGSLEQTQQQLATEQFESTVSLPDNISQSTIGELENEIKQLRQKLSQSEDERSLMRERLNEVELEYRQAIDDRASTVATYEEHLQGLIQERNALVEQQQLQADHNQHAIAQLQQQMEEMRHVSEERPTNELSTEEIESLKEELEEKSEELKDLTEKYLALRSQLDANTNVQTLFDAYKQETEQRMADYQNQVEQLTHERRNLLDERQMSTSSPLPTSDTDNQAKVNTKLKRALHSLKEKINRVVTEQPDLFHNVGAETSERLDHLISTVEHQATQIGTLQAERNEIEAQLQNEIRELQGSVEAYRYQIENERPMRSEQLVTSEAPPSDEISQSTIENTEKEIKQLKQKLSQNEDERSLLRERLNEVEVEYRQAIDDGASTVAMYEEQLQSLVQERNALVEERETQLAASQQEINQLEEQLAKLKESSQDTESLNLLIEQQSDQLKDLNEKYLAVSAQLESQIELEREKAQEMQDRLQHYENQIGSLTRERENLLDERQKNTASPLPTADTDKQAKLNTKLKRALHSLKEKINRVVTDQPDLFQNVGEETSERLDRLISTVEHQATQIETLQTERNEIEAQLRNEMNELQNSFDLYRQQTSDAIHHEALPSTSAIVHQQQSDTDLREAQEDDTPLKTANDGQWSDWTTDENLHPSADEETPSMTNRLFSFLKNAASSLTEETPTNDWNDQTSPLQLPSDNNQHTTFSPSSADHLLKQIENKIQEIITEFPTLFSKPSENPVNNLDQLISIIRNLENQIEELQNASTAEEDRKSQEIQSASSPPADQRISRRVFEQEILAWSKESERLKDIVKQIQGENKKLKDIILKFEPIIHDYMRENERLKEENQQLSLLTYPLTTENSHSSDTDICYLTLKWLTYEVAQRTSDPTEPTLFRSDQNEAQLRQRLIDTERQMRSIRLYSEKLKKQFKYIQNEINAKNHELAALKAEIDKLRTSETQYRHEVDRLKVDLQCDQVKFQQLERELSDLKLERTNIDDAHSADNLRELLDLKERELNALKEKLDYTIRAHQLELQEAIKANQFSLDNVQRFEQLDQQNQEKRKQLEKRLGKICQIVRPLINNQYLFQEESIIDFNALQQIITDTEAEERVINSLGPIRDCLGLLESQMKELQENLIENHTRRSKRSQERSEPSTTSNENQWLTTQRIPQFESIPINRDFFLATSSIDLIESDVRLCLDDILDEVIVRTTVK